MHRLPDWDARLAAYLEPLRLSPFGPYGRYDCCIFAAGGVIAMTGVDPMPEFRGRYSTRIGYLRALKRYGAGTLPATLDTKFDRIPASLAQRGDLIMTGGHLAIAFNEFAFAVGEAGEREGLLRLERAEWVDPTGWRVPYG
jgi:hypothetical protein